MARRQCFTTWMRVVESICWQLCGCSTDDLPDRDWQLLYDDMMKPSEAVRLAKRDL